MSGFADGVRTSAEGTACLAVTIALVGKPASLLDVGCGKGHLVTFARQLGIAAAGVDLEPTPGMLQSNLEYLNVFSPHEWVTCWEVAEHLQHADVLSKTLASAVASGGYLFFTAAQPGQGGDGHVNEQPLSYWRDKLTAFGLTYHPGLTTRLSLLWSLVTDRAWWYAPNLQVFRR